MRVDQVRNHINGLSDASDASWIFRCTRGSLSVGELRRIEGRDDADSVMPKPSGDGVRVSLPGRFSL